jgi:hypothetical protein
VIEDLGAKYDHVRASALLELRLRSPSASAGLGVAGLPDAWIEAVGGAEANHLRTEDEIKRFSELQTDCVGITIVDYHRGRGQRQRQRSPVVCP